MHYSQTLLRSGIVDALIDKAKNIELLAGIVVLLDDTMESSGTCHHKIFYVLAVTFC